MPTIIAWTQETWSPSTGCSKVSAGCQHCYAERLSLKFGWSTLPWTAANAAQNVRLHPERLAKPATWKEPRRIFVNSMSDLFHEQVPDEFIARVFEVMASLPQHTFQVLTKRPERMATWPGPWTPNIWAGTSVENARNLGRLDWLRQCGAVTRFVSFEPLLEPLGRLNLDGIHWCIVGGESGPGYRPMDHAWARDIRDHCVAAGVAFFFKQSSARITERGTELIEADGTRSLWQQYPPVKGARTAK